MTTAQEPKPSVDAIVGEKVHQIIWRRRIPVAELARTLGVAGPTMSRKLRGSIAWSAQDVVLVAGVLHVDPADLLPSLDRRARQDSNLRPEDYKSPTSVIIDLGAERARRRTSTRDVELPQVAKVLQFPTRMLAAA